MDYNRAAIREEWRHSRGPCKCGSGLIADIFQSDSFGTTKVCQACRKRTKYELNRDAIAALLAKHPGHVIKPGLSSKYATMDPAELLLEAEKRLTPKESAVERQARLYKVNKENIEALLAGRPDSELSVSLTQFYAKLSWEKLEMLALAALVPKTLRGPRGS